MKALQRVVLSFVFVLALCSVNYAQTISQGKKVKFDYTLKVEGNVVDSSEGRGPIEIVQGDGKIIPGLAKELEGMKVGDEKHVVVKPEDGYGLPDPKAFKEVEKTVLATEGNPIQVGQIYEFQSTDGQSFPGIISEVKDKTVIVDFNHPLAGKELNFDVKIVSIE